MSKVQITYSAPALFLSSDNWLQIRHELAAQFPLHDLVWKSTIRPSSRTIRQLDVHFLSLDDVKDDINAEAVPTSLLDRPLVNIYVVTCEDNDVYRLTVKKQIKDWHTLVTQRKTQEWLIILVLRSDAKSSGGFLKMKSNILDKIKSDFNSEKRDRCVQVVWSPNQDNLTVWTEARAKISDSLLSAFDSVVTQREEEVKKSEGQRQMPGWSFSNFFLLKESLALSFAGMLLLEDALLQYDELEAAFFQVTKERSPSWFGMIVDENQLDDATPILDVARKPYAELLVAHTISIFDLRIYLLARQCDIMAKQGRVVDVARKVQTLVGVLSKTLADTQDTIPEFFIESWGYSAAMSTIHQCNRWSENAENENGDSLSELNSVKAELLDYASSQLTNIGVALKYLPDDGPFQICSRLSALGAGHFSPSSTGPRQRIGKISSEQVLKTLSSAEAFYDLYYSVTHQAIDMYAKVPRRKFAIKLYGRLAALDRIRGRMDAANKSFKSLPGHYGPSKWAALETYMLLKSLETLADIAAPKNDVWVETCLNALKGFVLTSELDRAMLENPSKVPELLQNLMDDVCSYSSSSETDIVTVNHPMLNIDLISGSVRLDGKCDGSHIDISIQNLLPINLRLSRVDVVLEGSNANELHYSAEDITLSFGKTSLSLFCPMPSVGVHAYRSCRLTAGKLLLEYVPEVLSDSKPRTRANKLAPTVNIPKDYASVDVDVSLADSVRFGTLGDLDFTLHSGRNDIDTAVLKIEAPPNVKLNFDATRLRNDELSLTSLKVAENDICISSLQAGQALVLSIPYEGPTIGMLSFKVLVEYRAPNSLEKARSVTLYRTVEVGLPITVNVQDIFRDNALFSVFSILSKDFHRVRIHSADLRPENGTDSGIVISGSEARDRPCYTATSEQAVNIIFKIESSTPRTEPCPLILSVQFKTEKEEIKDLIVNCLKELTSGDSTALPTIRKLSDLLVQKLTTEDSWVEEYQLTSTLRLPIIVTNNPTENSLIDGVRNKLLNGMTEDRWRTADIPVELPFMNIVSAARIELLPQSDQASELKTNRDHLYAGQPVLAKLTIRTSFHWGSKESADLEPAYNMGFEIQDSRRDWLVSGRRKGEFLAKNGQSFHEPITLIPLHHGKMNMPQVKIRPIVDRGDGSNEHPPSSECVQEHAATLITVLPRGGRSTFMIEMPGE